MTTRTLHESSSASLVGNTVSPTYPLFRHQQNCLVPAISNFRILSSVILTTLLIQGCSLIPDVKVPGMDKITGENGMFRDRKGEYLQAETLPRTVIPEGLDGYIIDDLLIIPDIQGSPEDAFLDAPRPRELAGSSDREVIIQRMESRSWIVVDVSPSQVWPRIRDYWRSNKIEIALENPTAGVMETSWFVLDGNILTREKVRVTVETGFQDNSAEIRLLQTAQPQATPIFDQITWPATSVDAAVESDLITALSTYLADVADLYTASSVSFLAGSISNAGKASLVTTPEGDELVHLQAAYDRSWAAVGRALQRANVAIIASDVDNGNYEVNYVQGSEDDEADKPGFFKRMITLNGLFSGDNSGEPIAMQIHLQKVGDIIEVKVSPAASAPSRQELDAGNALLHLIRNTIA